MTRILFGSKKIVRLVILLWFVCQSASAAVHKCSDENGNVSYSQMPCAKVENTVKMETSGTKSAKNQVCEQTKQFTEQVVARMRAGADSGSVIAEHGGLNGISKPALAIINYIYTYRLSRSMTSERISGMVISKCNNSSFGDVSYADVPGAEDPESPEVIQRKQLEAYLEERSKSDDGDQVIESENLENKSNAGNRVNNDQLRDKKKEQKACQSYKLKLKGLDSKMRQGYSSSEGDSYRKERRKYRNKVSKNCR